MAESETPIDTDTDTDTDPVDAGAATTAIGTATNVASAAAANCTSSGASDSTVDETVSATVTDSNDQPSSEGGRRHRVVTLALWVWFLAISAIRIPELVFGRPPYAEEAVAYYRYAAGHGLWDTLSFRLGYLALWSNISAYIETRLPLSWLPQVSVLLGLAGPALVAALVMRAHTVWWRRALALAAIATTITMLYEWASVIHFQFWAMCAVLLLAALPVNRSWQNYTDLGVAFMAGLSAVASAAVVPWLALSAWRSEPTLRRHRFQLAGVLAVTALFNVIVSDRRPSSMPVGLLLPLLALKLIWQPITGTWGDGFGTWLVTQPAIVANSIALAILAAAVAVIVAVTRGAWRIVGLASIFIGAFMLWYSIPPARGLAVSVLGGRYAVAAVVPLLVTLAVARVRRPSDTGHDAGSNDTGRQRSAVGMGRQVAAVVAVAYVVAAVLVGLWQGVDRDNYGDDTTVLFDRDLVSYQADPGTTLDIYWGGCRLTDDPIDQHRGASVTIKRVGNRIDVTGIPAELDRDQPTALYVIGFLEDGTAVNLASLADAESFFIGGERVPACFLGPDPAPASPFAVTDRHQATLDVSSLPGPVESVVAGVGRNYNDALIKGNAEMVDWTDDG